MPYSFLRENHRKIPFARRSAHLAFCALLFIVTVALSENATSTLTIAAPSSNGGTGTAPIASLSPSSRAFASEPVRNTTAAQSTTLTNGGSAAFARWGDL